MPLSTVDEVVVYPNVSRAFMPRPRGRPRTGQHVPDPIIQRALKESPWTNELQLAEALVVSMQRDYTWIRRQITNPDGMTDEFIRAVAHHPDVRCRFEYLKYGQLPVRNRPLLEEPLQALIDIASALPRERQALVLRCAELLASGEEDLIVQPLISILASLTKALEVRRQFRTDAGEVDN